MGDKEILGPVREAGHRSQPPVFSIILLPTLACNCTCSHCFEELGGKHIDDQGWEVIFSKAKEVAEAVHCRTLRLYWQGGEVLCLRPGNVQKALDTAAAVFEDTDIALEHHLQTNLLLYDSPRWKEVISRFSLRTISSSLDFPNVYRKTSSLGSDRYNQVWLEKKEIAERDGFTVSVVSLPNPDTLALGAERFYRFFRDEVGVTNLQVNFPFPGPGGGLQLLDLDELSRFMSDLYEVWVASGRDLNLSPYRALEDKIYYSRGTVLCAWSYSCAQSLLAISPGGDVAQCDCWVSSFREYLFGSVLVDSVDALLDCGPRKQILDRPLHLVQQTKCGECRFWKLCYGGCPVRAFAFSGDIVAPDHYCPVYYRMFFSVWEHADRFH